MARKKDKQRREARETPLDHCTNSKTHPLGWIPQLPNLSLVDMRPEKIRHSMKDHRVTWRGNQTIFAQGAVGEQGLKACQTDLEEN